MRGAVVLPDAGRLWDELRAHSMADRSDKSGAGDEPKEVKTLGMHVRKGWQTIAEYRPTSFYLLLAIIVVLLLGLQIAEYRENPKQSVFVLICLFIFFFAVMVFAILEAGQIIRRHLRDKRELWQSTLGEEEFLTELGKRVRQHRDS
ncbi:MAG: hypothetical protein HUU46_19085 [Candidatus Hydrogenedentes bacterium]|nr:hypothetical protein [Candidatus Hydrogenedentota bacterium]